MTLTKYKQKRNFNNTPEPKGKQNNKSPFTKLAQNQSRKLKKQPIFVVQYHKARTTHYDFRLEYNGVLLSWAVPKGLPQNSKSKRLAVMVEDHPLDYATFEGVIPKGNYGAGVVEIYDKGFYIPLENFKDGLKSGQIRFELLGETLKGKYTLIKTDEKNWIMLKLSKETKESNNEVQKEEKLPFNSLSPQLATLLNKIPTGKDWVYEIKYDGYRIITFVENKKAKLLSRNGLDYTKKFNQISSSLLKLTKNTPFVLDGEVVCFDEYGKSDFGLLQKNIKQKKDNFTYVIFDILALGNKDLTKKPLLERKEILQNLLKGGPKNLMFSEHIEGKGKELFNMAKKMGLEGIIAKEASSAYNQTRDNTWLKIKCYKEQEFVIGGFATSDKNNILSAILVGYYKNGELICVGKVGTGFSEELKKELASKFKKLIQKNSSFKNYDKQNENTFWLKPELIAQIKYAELTKDNLLRQPVFIGLRTDKNPKDLVLEENSNDN